MGCAMKMTFYLKDVATDKFRRVSRKAAMDYMNDTYGKGKFEEKVKAAERFHSNEYNIICSWEDFRIKKFCKEK